MQIATSPLEPCQLRAGCPCRALAALALIVSCGESSQPPGSTHGSELDASVVDATLSDTADAQLDRRDAFVEPSSDASLDTGHDAGDAVDSDAGKTADDVPECQPLPESFEAVMPASSQPLFGNTVWFDPDIITEDDPSSFVEVVAAGTGKRNVFDRRTNSFNQIEAILFKARFGSDTEVEVRINPEFSQSDATAAAIRHATAIGRIPAFLFASLETITIHKGKELYGGGGNDLLIHTEQTADYEADGVLEEVFIHEATHTTIDGRHASAANWRAAQKADGRAISPYARDHPASEDLSETMGPYLAARFRADRLEPGVAAKLEAALPNRLKYLDCLELSMDPPR
jgi:hypothetical protein